MQTIYSQEETTGDSRGLWTPFCDYSPEWVAVTSARSIGATPLFIDLPAWHKVFEGEENRYSDRHTRASNRLGQMAAQLGFEGTDALWDHLFEGPPGDEDTTLEDRLAVYFASLRGDELAQPGDDAREDFMARFIAWAAGECDEAERGDDERGTDDRGNDERGNDDRRRGVVVICGGYHKVALERLWPTLQVPEERPSITPREGLRVGSYLVRFSFKRLDSFQGYAAGMPSPAFYQNVWDTGDAGEGMLFRAIHRLRARGQRVSAADAIAARTLALGLASIRGRDTLRRVDVLDGLAGALVKEALDVPLPWTQRGVLPARTHPLLVELVSVFSGDGVGELASGTPRPPLVEDVMAELARVGLPFEGPEPVRVRVDLTTPRGVDQSCVLHRLRILEVPGFACTRGPSFSRQRTDLSEEWSLQRRLETDSALIEAALYGGQLVSAAGSRLEERTRTAPGLSSLADALVDGVNAGLAALSTRWLASIQALVAHEANLAELGAALSRLVALARGEGIVRLGGVGAPELLEVLGACYDRGLWLYEGIMGPTAAFEDGDVNAVRALRDAARQHGGGVGAVVDIAHGRAVCERRAVDAGAPPALRGAALGFLWSVHAEREPAECEPAEREHAEISRAIVALRAAARPESVGDFLGGLFALARGELLRENRTLLAAIDEMVGSMMPHDFFVALPALRQAFAYFPPRERLSIAEAVLGVSEGASPVDPRALLDAPASTETVLRAYALEESARAIGARFGLAPRGDR